MKEPTRHFYGPDLAHVHAEDFARYWDGAADWLADLARRVGQTPFVVDIGCGDGRMLAELADRGINGQGIDVSESFVVAAKARGLEVEVGDAKHFEMPTASMVYALGEVLAYEDCSGSISLEPIVRAAASSLLSGGVLVFDVTTPAMNESMSWREVNDWMVASRCSITKDNRLERQIVTFRRDGTAWRRSQELHHQKLLDNKTVEMMLRDSGFSVELLSSFGKVALPLGRQGYLAKKS